MRSRAGHNVVEKRKFSERLASAVARNHANALSTVEVIREVIKLAQDMRASAQRGEAEGRSPEEVASTTLLQMLKALSK